VERHAARHRRRRGRKLGHRRAAHLVAERRALGDGLGSGAVAAYAGVVLWISQSYAVAVAHYVPAAAFLLLALVVAYRRCGGAHLLAGMAGVALSFLAAMVQQSETGALGLSHNAVYHIVQAVALLLIFVAALGLVRWLG
jgi:hypothetical protein